MRGDRFFFPSHVGVVRVVVKYMLAGCQSHDSATVVAGVVRCSFGYWERDWRIKAQRSNNRIQKHFAAGVLAICAFRVCSCSDGFAVILSSRRED